MNTFKKNTPLVVTWKILGLSEMPVSLVGKTIKFKYKTSRGENDGTSDCTLKDDSVEWTLPVSKQKFCGVYSLELSVYHADGTTLGRFTYDNAFLLSDAVAPKTSGTETQAESEAGAGSQALTLYSYSSASLYELDAAEADRQAAFNTNEANRQSTFETSEESRKTTFSNNETNRQSVFETKEESRGTTFANNEDSRQATFESSEASRKSTFNNNESVRQANEDVRKSNETTRQSNESTRQTNETARQSQEAARQTTFSNNEANRQSTFETKEAARQSTFDTNEATRQANETTRQTAESERQTNETARQEAEASRQGIIDGHTEQLNKLSSKIDDLTIEVDGEGILFDGDVKENDIVLFTSNDVNEGDGITFTTDKIYGNGGIRFFNSEDISLGYTFYATSSTTGTATIPADFFYAKSVFFTTPWDSLKIVRNISNPISSRLSTTEENLSVMESCLKTTTLNANVAKGKITGRQYYLYNAPIRENDVTLFTVDNVSVEDTVVMTVDKIYSVGGIKLLNTDGTIIATYSFTAQTSVVIKIPKGFAYAKSCWDLNWDNLTLVATEKMSLPARVLNAETEISDIRTFLTGVSTLYSGDGFSADDITYFTSNDVDEGDTITITTDKTYAAGAIGFYKSDGTRITYFSPISSTTFSCRIPRDFSYAKSIWYSPYYEWGNLIITRQAKSALQDIVNTTNINIKSSDKVGFFSNSFLEGYAMYGKHAIEKLMLFSDYLPYNYSKSGDDMAEEAYRLDKDQAWLGDCKPSEVGPIKYGIIMHQDNDGILFMANHRSYYENAKHLGYQIMSLGGQPIISTEHDWEKNYLVFQRLCQDEGWSFADWGKIYKDIPIGIYAPMWLNRHPSTRSNWCQVHGLLPIIEALPRPVQSIKLFRKRDFIDASDLKNLLYNTNLDRAERWAEIHNGQTSIVSGQEAKFDRCGSFSYKSYPCEYQKLIKYNKVSFGTHLLADITTPYNTRSVSKFELTIEGSGISKLYARQIRYMDDSWLPSAGSKYIAFGVTGGADLLSVGDTITISGITRDDGQDLNKSYTISSIKDGYMLTSEESGSHVTSGTDSPICSVSGVTLSGSYDFPTGSYIDNYDKPIGQWTEIEFSEEDGKFSVSLTVSQIEKFGAADKFCFMAQGTDISITNIYAEVAGSSLKERHEKAIQIPYPKIGQSCLSTTTFADTDTAWQNLSNLTSVNPVTDGTNTETLPGSVKEIPTDGWVAQQIDTTKITATQYKKPVRVQIQILARWFPKYILTDDDYTTSELTPDSFDMAKLEVQLNTSALPATSAQFPVTTMYIGAWWNVYTFEMDIVGTPSWLTLKCVSKRVQIAKCDLVVIDD